MYNLITNFNQFSNENLLNILQNESECQFFEKNEKVIIQLTISTNNNHKNHKNALSILIFLSAFFLSLALALNYL